VMSSKESGATSVDTGRTYVKTPRKVITE